MYMSDSETEEDGGYLKRVKPENKSIVILKGSIAVGDLESGVDFEIEEVNRELLDGPNGDARLEAEDNEEYISEICSPCNPFKSGTGSDEEDGGDLDLESLKRKMKDITDMFSSHHKELIFKRVLEASPLKGELGAVVSSGLVSVDYSAYLEGQDEPFDSTRRRRHPHTFTIGDCSTIEGIELGIRTMKIGERSQFIVAPELAYGKLGLPNVVPANSEVLFDIQVKDCVLGDAIEQLARNPEQEASEGSQRSSTDDLQLRLKASKQAFKMGNSRYRVRSYKDALSHYRKAADMVSWESARDEAEDYVRMALWAKIMRGVCRCLFELAKYRPCLAECKQVLEYYPDDPVVNLLKGQCFILLGNNIDAAIRAFERGLCSCPGNASLSEALNSAIKQKHSEIADEKKSVNNQKLAEGMQKFCGSSKQSDTKEQQSKSRAAKFSKLKDNFKNRIQTNIMKVVDGSETWHDFPTMNLTSLEFEYIKCAAEDAGLKQEERGVAVDGRLSVFKSK